ncbi:tetratricopeptide repeat protein 12-like [Gigantopelta aegis]|uniref:tetratricopeptide repeat protein 12-like n=1 Tax=Gigantopelta aegis TaxID=1735272 RepID=UPI001B88819A|nr:tetratricopeptide repeat protein 12-like [Gigantopelta aegis]
MATSQDAKDLESFLSKVEQLESIVKGLNSTEDKERKDAMKKADDVISLVQSKRSAEDDDDDDLPKTKTGFSKTVINNSPSSTSDSIGDTGPISHGGFMAAMEQDAAERAERRRRAEKDANEIKEKGNEAFHKGDYLRALELYTEGLTKQKDNLALHTNRAQTNIKLKKFEDALTDCEWALKVNPLSIKAYIHMGRSHLGLKKYQQARDDYHQAIKIDPRKEKLIQDYIAEVDRTELAEHQEKEARAHFECGDSEAQGIVRLIEKVGKPDHLPMYYSGGFRVIANMLNTTDDKTLFRTHGGLAMSSTHPVLLRCLTASIKALSQDERDVLCAAFDMFTAACTNNESNQQHMFDDDDLADRLLAILEAKLKTPGRVLQTSFVNLLHTVSISDIGRITIVAKFDISRLLSALFLLMRCPSSSLALMSAALLNNIALEKRFKSHLRDHVDDRLLPAFKSLAHDSSCLDGVMSSCLSTIMNLAGDPFLRAALSNKQELWESSLHLLDVHKSRLTDGEEVISAALGLLMNLSVETGQCVRQFGQRVCEHCLRLCRINPSHNNIIDRSLGLAGHILPHCVPAVEWVCCHDGPHILLQHIMSDSEVRKKACIKSLTACTQLIESARHSVVDHKGLPPLMGLLKSDDEVVVGNAALCLSHCCQVQKAATDLVQTAIIKDLLILTRDGRRAAVQQNCAILIAKLAQADNRHLDRLRELHGIEILTSCVTF